MVSQASAPVFTRPYSTGAISWGAATLDSGRPCLLIRAKGPERDSASRLDRVRRAHEAAPISEIPQPISWDFDAPSPWLALDCDPIGTLAELRERWPKRSVPYTEGIVLTRTLARVLDAAHRAPAGPHFVGALSASQVIVDRTGMLRVIGLGFDEEAWEDHAHRAPASAMGSPATTSSDVHMCLLFMRRRAWTAGASLRAGTSWRALPGRQDRRTILASPTSAVLVGHQRGPG
jgi:hypothetical protein